MNSTGKSTQRNAKSSIQIDNSISVNNENDEHVANDDELVSVRSEDFDMALSPNSVGADENV